MLRVSELGPSQTFVAFTTLNQSLTAVVFEMVAKRLGTVEQYVTIVAKSNLWTLISIMITELKDVHGLGFHRLLLSRHDPATLWINADTGF